jgi:thiol-disulfide isomerase/thioredoxin
MSLPRYFASHAAILAIGLGAILSVTGCNERESRVAGKSPRAADKRQPTKSKQPDAVRAETANTKSAPATSTDAKPADSKAANSARPATKSAEASSKGLDLTIPEGDAEELLAFLLKLDQVRLEEDTPEAIAEFIRVQKVILEGADKLLAKPELDEKTRLTGIQLKWATSGVLLTLDDPGAEERFLALAKELVGDKNQSVAKIARIQLRQLDIERTVRALRQGTAKNTDKLVQDLYAILGEEGLRYGQFTLVRQAARDLESVDKYEESAQVHKAFEQAFKKSGEPALAEAAVEIAAKAATRLGWIGKEAEVKERRYDGQKFDMSEFKGKVVLVDFWATWCPPCIAELPNVIENYEKYHDRGFEVVGISLDVDKEALDKFLAERKLPWPTLWSEEIAGQISENPYDHPLAKKYGVDALPSTVLVDQQGKVVALGVSGKRLGEKLADLLGEPDEDSSAASDE